MPTKKTPKTVNTKVRQYLSVKFTEPEINKMGREIADHMNQIEKARDEEKAVKAKFKDRIEGHESKARIASRLVNAGFDMKEVDCNKFIDYTNDRVVITRLDTNEVVEDRELEDHERQLPMPAPGDLKEAAEKKKAEDDKDDGPDDTGDDPDQKKAA